VERPRRKVRFARLIHRHVRAFGRPSAGAAFSGVSCLTWLLLIVALSQPGANLLPVVHEVCRLRPMRKTHALIQVALALMEDPQGRHWGYDLSRRAGVRSGVLYPILHRMLDVEWLEDGWEDPAQLGGKRPPRRYYELTDEGRLALGGILQEARSDARFGSLVGRFA
jgi:PadR family transcriptional regulator PadR